MDIFFVINWFFLYSFLGYLLECLVLSRENRMLVYNRGFGHGPFCIIYGFGAVGAHILLKPLALNFAQLYLASMIMATVMELVTAYIMIRLFGSFWWDYSQKPFNYKGIICLESSIAWGFLGVFFFWFLDQFAINMVGLVSMRMQRGLAVGLVVFYAVDFVYTLIRQLRKTEEEESTVVGRLKVD